MNWLLFAFIWTIFAWIASTLMDVVARSNAGKMWQYKWLVLQYIAISSVALLMLLGAHVFFAIPLIPASMSVQTIWMLLLIGCIGFWWIWCLFKWFEKLNPAIALVIAQLTVFIQYFINIRLFDASESLSTLKIILALIFFFCIWQFLFQKQKKQSTQSFSLNTYALYPLWTALCRSAFTIANTYFIKNDIFHPIQSLFFTETAVWIIALLVYAISYWYTKPSKTALSENKLFAWLQQKDILTYVWIWLTQVVWFLFFYVAYTDTASNTVNIIRLFQIMFTWLFARILFKQKMNKKNILLMICAFCILLTFVLI